MSAADCHHLLVSSRTFEARDSGSAASLTKTQKPSPCQSYGNTVCSSCICSVSPGCWPAARAFGCIRLIALIPHSSQEHLSTGVYSGLNMTVFVAIPIASQRILTSCSCIVSELVLRWSLPCRVGPYNIGPFNRSQCCAVKLASLCLMDMQSITLCTIR